MDQDELEYKARMAEIFMAHPRMDGIREAAKLLNVNKFVFANWLMQQDVIECIDYDMFPSEEIIKNGYVTMITGIAEDGVFHQLRFTPSGIDWIAKQFPDGVA